LPGSPDHPAGITSADSYEVASPGSIFARLNRKSAPDVVSGKDVPLGVALVVLFAGIYTIGAAEAGWWLPGRNTTGEGHERAESLDPR
jgi:hypothetical protein